MERFAHQLENIQEDLPWKFRKRGTNIKQQTHPLQHGKKSVMRKSREQFEQHIPNFLGLFMSSDRREVSIYSGALAKYFSVQITAKNYR